MFVTQTRSEPEVVTIFPAASWTAAFFIPQVLPHHSSGFTTFFVLCFLLFCFSALSENCMTITSSRARNNIRSKKTKKCFLAPQYRIIERCLINSPVGMVLRRRKNLNWALSCLCSIPPLSRVRSCDVHHSFIPSITP